MSKKVLYFSASIGLGHIERDLAIAGELRRRIPDVEISWIAAHPANIPLQEAGERLHPGADLFANDSGAAERAATDDHRLNIHRYCTKVARVWWQNVRAFKEITAKERYDLVVADEAYEVGLGLRWKYLRLGAPFAMIYDFFGYFALSRHPLDLLLERFWNHEFAVAKRLYDGKDRVALFVGEPEDVPDRSLGFLLPNCRDRAKDVFRFLGYIVPFDPGDYRDKEKVRAKLGYGDEPLVICAVGGTAVGKELLELCGRAYPLIRNRIPNLRMVLVCGPRLDCNEVDAPPAVDIRGYVPGLYEHFAACDLAIVQGGGSTTLELTALQRPFIYLPLEGHFEQRIHVAGRVARHGAGVELCYSETGPESLAETVVSNLGKELNYPNIPTDGASKAADILTELAMSGEGA